MQAVADWPLYILDKSGMSLDEVIANGRIAMHRHGVKLIGLDYLQRLKIRSDNPKEDTRLKVGRASTALADLVKNTNTRTLLLSQLSRKGDMTTPPTMDRLRESGQIENDAHNILLFHLNWDSDKNVFGQIGSVFIPKQRFGIPTNLSLHKDKRSALWKWGHPPDY
jgi:replicative DNA helicase